MKKIIAKSVTLENLMGCRNLTINFNKDITNIFADNGIGKSRIVDTVQWILFGKNAAGKADHGIKDTKDTSFNQQEHIGILVLNVNDVDNSLKRVYKEKWTKKKGSEFAEMTGHTTDYFFNDVPVSATEYSSKISDIVNESVFKMITNPLYFTSLDWKKQREVLTEICPAPSNEELAGDSPQYKALIANLVQGKELEDYRKQIAATIVKSKELLKAIPTRIDEVLKGKGEVFEWNKLEGEKSDLEKSLSIIEENLSDKANAFDELLKVENTKKLVANGIKNELDTIKQNLMNANANSNASDDSALKTAKSELESKKGELSTAESGLKSLEVKKTNLEAEIKTLTESLELKRGELKTAAEKEFIFDDSQCVCPTCKREFESGDIETKKSELRTNFIADQAKNIESIQSSGKRLKGEKETKEDELKTITERITTGGKVIVNLQTEIILLEGNVETENAKLSNKETVVFDIDDALLNHKEYQSKLHQFIETNATIQQNPTIDNTELNNQKREIQESIDAIKTKLSIKDQNDKIDNRISDLKIEQQNLASEIANVEKEFFVIEKFNKLKVESIESQVNNRFKYVKFRLFKDLINGGSEEVCEALVNDVPFSHANTAGRLNAGLDIINLLCEHYQVLSPIFLDNRESTSQIIETDSQIINLFVSEPDKVLRIE